MYDSFRMRNMGKVDKICQLYLQPVVKTFSLSCIGRTVVKIRQTRLTLCCAARDEGERELRIISSVSYSFFIFFSIIENHIIWQALVLFLLLTLLLLGYNQEIMWTTEHLPLQRPNKSQLMTSYGQRSLRGRVGKYLLRYWHLTTCGYPSKTWDAKNLSRFSANVPSLKKLISHENFTNCPEIWSKYSQDIKL